MPKMTIAIDSQDHVTSSSLTTSPKKLGLLASISLTDTMISKVEDGFGTSHKSKRTKTTRQTVPGDRQGLIDDGCELIATIGGLFVNVGISGITTIPFVSMTGAIPANPDQYCSGGISLETLTLNKARRDFLVTSKSISASNIYLYRDGHNDNPGELPLIERNAWGQNYVNYTGNIYNDLNQAGGVPATAEGLVISVSPVWLRDQNMSLLVAAANTWLTQPPAGRTRYVVYPLQIYSEANPQNAANGKNILFGPDLYQVLRLLGFYARLASDGKTPGWLPMGYIVKEL